MGGRAPTRAFALSPFLRVYNSTIPLYESLICSRDYGGSAGVRILALCGWVSARVGVRDGNVVVESNGVLGKPLQRP